MAHSTLRSTLGLIMCFTATTLAASGPYTIRYYSAPSGNVHCCARSLACRNVPQFDCCEAPPSRSSFPEVYVNSGAQGIVSFHETDDDGSCLGCSSTASTDLCITNVPFEPVAVIDARSALCSTTANANPDRKRNDLATKVPIIEGTGGNASIPAVCNKINAVGIGGYDYKTPENGKDEFMEDFFALSDEELILKWALVLHDDDGNLQRRQSNC